MKINVKILFTMAPTPFGGSRQRQKRWVGIDCRPQKSLIALAESQKFIQLILLRQTQRKHPKAIKDNLWKESRNINPPWN